MSILAELLLDAPSRAVLIAGEREGVIAQEWARHEGVAEHTGAESEGVPHSSYSALLPQGTPLDTATTLLPLLSADITMSTRQLISAP